MDAVEPDWSLLPDRPREFFGLGEKFDPTELKRAYTRLIKRYKPERAPEQFQRIRAAYEQLDERLRYGETNAAAISPTIVAPAAPHIEIERVDAVALVREFGPSGAREKLRAAADHDPAAWSRLALIDDVLSDDPLAALRTLIEGARATRGRPEVLGLLHGLLREELDAQHASKALTELSEATAGRGRANGYPPHLYWFLTEHQWLSLAARTRFDGFKTLLARCAKNVGEAGRIGELVLLLRLRRRLALRADEAWLDAVDRDLSENLRNLPDWAEADYDYTLWLARYRDVREEFRGAHPFREELDGALAAIVSGDEVEADRSFLRAQVACLERREELFEAFLEPSGADDFAVELLSDYAEGWRARRGLDERNRADSAARRMEFARRLEKRWKRSALGWVYTIARSVLGYSALAAIVVISILSSRSIGAWSWAIGVVLLLLFVLSYALDWFWRPWSFFFKPVENSAHRKQWRPQTADFFVESRCAFDDLAETLSSDDAPGYTAMKSRIVADRGLALFSLAVRSLN